MYEVEIDKCDGKPVYSDFMAGIALSGCPFEITVLGNIFDNPSLAGGKVRRNDEAGSNRSIKGF